ncbi:hypothetical protein FA95DRAFT_1677818 [Auriscalpium vulgare]|uniref:Uncharacterized protein n=1 Tax=Auriscalpium vulgare TaxID=40419 RepID=A0ACB8RXL6_9AGAM|nr:hypothetical protein FA95DRAFT_1677818 [Auriscalpium vulgare]
MCVEAVHPNSLPSGHIFSLSKNEHFTMSSVSSAHSSTSSLKITSFPEEKASSLSGDQYTPKEETADVAAVDGGVQAWTFVFCSFLLEGLVWGLPFSYGVLKEWYLSNPPFEGASEVMINAIGTVTLAIQYMEGIALAFVFGRFPHWLRPIMIGGFVVRVTSMFISSFCDQGCLYMPVIFWLSEWLVLQRSLATDYLLQRIGFRWTIRAIALTVGILGGLAILGVKPRLPIPPASSRQTAPPLDFSFLKSPVFISVVSLPVEDASGLLSVSCPGHYRIHAGARILPGVSIYIPTYAVALGYSRLSGTLTLAIFNLASVVGQMVCGYYCDLGPYTHVMLFSSMLSSILVYALWGFAHSLALLSCLSSFSGSSAVASAPYGRPLPPAFPS